MKTYSFAQLKGQGFLDNRVVHGPDAILEFTPQKCIIKMGTQEIRSFMQFRDVYYSCVGLGSGIVGATDEVFNVYVAL